LGSSPILISVASKEYLIMGCKFSRSEIEDLIHQTLDLWHVPGLAIAVVQDDQVIFCDGFGYRNVSRSLPVTANTFFPIASCTKAFTAMSVAMLVDAGLVEWDQPVQKYLPDFKMWDDFATLRLTPRDLLSHRCGLPGHDMMWYATKFNRREIFERLRYLEPTLDLRTGFQYQNLMYAVIGLLVESISGISWEQFVQTKILDRIGMENTNLSTHTTQNSANFASPYLYQGGQCKELPIFTEEAEKIAMCPAGGICSCVSDMAIWLQVQLNQGKIGGEALVSEENMNQMHTPHMFVADPIARKKYGYEFTSYGLGWGMRSHKGEFLLEHDGMKDGFYSLVSLMPQHKIGIVALSNADAYWTAPQANLAPNIISYAIYDRLLGVNLTDWNALMKSTYDEMAEAIRKYKEEAKVASPIHEPTTHLIDRYLGEYEHPGYGIVSVRLNEAQYQIVMNETLFLPIRHVHSDTFSAYFELADQWQDFSFVTGPEGQVNQVSIPMEPRVKEIVFNRIRTV
jgi:CubicO group peptidase (beta-lactamase class C family)